MTEKPSNASRYRPMTVGQVAEVVGVPRETLRTWLRDEVFDQLRLHHERQEGGWRRFSDFEAITIGVYGKILECSRDHEAARVGMLLCAKLIMDEWVEVDGLPYLADETFDKDRMMFFWREENGIWHADIAEIGESFNKAMNSRLDETYKKGPSFLVLNLGTILKSVLLSLLQVQIAMEEGK